MKLATLAGDFDAALKSMQLLRTAEYQVDSAPVLRLWLETMNGSTDEIEQSINDVQRLLNTQADQSENTVPEISISLGIAGLSNPNPRVPGLLGQAITEFARETSLSPIDQHVFIAANALIAILNSDNDAANNLLPASELLPGGFLHSRDSATMASDRLLGLLNVTAGNRKSAIQCFQDSLEFTRNCGAPVELARTCLDYSELLSECDDSGERAKASELQDEAIAIATELGMKPLLERVLAQREILKV
jgi:hypothetical protein